MRDGFEELIQKMKSLTGEQLEKANRSALKQVGIVIRDAIRERAPVLKGDEGGATSLKPGELKRDIRIGIHIAKDAVDTNRARVGPGKKTRHVAGWVENGHMARRSKKKEGPARFVPAHPFIRPAAEAVEGIARAVYRNEMVDEIARVMDGESD